MSDYDQDPRTGVSLSDGPVRNPDVEKIRKEREPRGPIRRLLSHTLTKKNLMALTGLFLCLFLVIHLFGNLQLLLPAETSRWQFNFYSKLLSENLFIKLISYVLFASILAHAVYALLITIQNRRSRHLRPMWSHDQRAGAWSASEYDDLPTAYADF
jgi:succinate dehydrogenase hydrophobic anchor subunit